MHRRLHSALLVVVVGSLLFAAQSAVAQPSDDAEPPEVRLERRSFIDQCAAKLGGALQGLSSSLRGAVGGLSSSVNGALGGLGSSVNGAVNGFGSSLHGALGGLGSSVRGFGSSLRGVCSSFLGRGFGRPSDHARAPEQPLLNRCVARLGGALNEINSSLRGAASGFGSSLHGALGGLGSSVRGFESSVRGVCSSLFGRRFARPGDGMPGAGPSLLNRSPASPARERSWAGQPRARSAFEENPPEEPPPDEGPARQPTWAALHREETRQTFEALAGSRPMTGLEVAEALRGAPIRGARGAQEFSEETPDRGVVQHKLVRTGTSASGQPTGYVRSTWTDPRTGEQVVAFNGTTSSWIRRGNDNGKVALVIRNQNLKDKNGAMLLPAGSRLTFARERLGDDMRTTMRRETLLGASKQRTTTFNVEGRAESFTMTRDPHKGERTEERIRVASDGSAEGLRREYDGKQLRAIEVDSRGNVKKSVLSSEQAEHLIRRIVEGEVGANPGQLERQGRKWVWRQPNEGREAMSVVTARGRGGELDTVESKFISPLGMDFGAVTQRHGKVRTGNEGVSPWAKQAKADAPQGDPDISEITMGHRMRVQETAGWINRVIKGKYPTFNIIIDPAANSGGAYAVPGDDRFEARFGTTVSTLKQAAQVPIGAHEFGHDTDPQIQDTTAREQTLDAQAESLRKIGAHGEATVAALERANLRRSEERFADNVAGVITAKVNQRKRDPKMTPAGALNFFTPWNWQPTDDYDSVKSRGRTMWGSYRAERKRQQLTSMRRRPFGHSLSARRMQRARTHMKSQARRQEKMEREEAAELEPASVEAP